MGGVEQNSPAFIDNIASRSNKSWNKHPIAKYKIFPYELLIRKPLEVPKPIDYCHCFLLTNRTRQQDTIAENNTYFRYWTQNSSCNWAGSFLPVDLYW